MYYYIVNPAAGSGTINSIQDRLKTTLHSLKIDGEFAKTLGPGDATSITEKALSRGIKTIVAVGGSETINEIITAINRHQHSDVAVGIIPTGKQNTLAHSLGISNWRQACEVLASRRLIEFSLITVNDHVFVQSLVIQPPTEASEPTEDPKPWQKIFTRPETHNQSLSYKATLGKGIKIRGQAARLEIYNQKFLEPASDNQLLLRIYDGAQSSNLWAQVKGLWANNAPGTSYSQLHGDSLHLRTPTLAEATLDGKTISAKTFNVELTDWKLRLITNLTPS